MPILEASRPDSELVQGDVLSGVTLFSSEVAKGTASRLQCSHCLVVSRDCVAVRDPLVVVAPVKRFKSTPSIEDEEDVRLFFENIRDGVVEPDLFYLGSFGEALDRYAARLDELCTVKLPADEAERRAWIGEHRLARLTGDFVRALPVRMFNTFSRVGYDDHTWYATPDLEWFVKQGVAVVAKRKADLAAAEAELAQTQATDSTNLGRIEAQAKRIRELRESLNKADAKLKPFEAELEVRKRK